MAYNNNIFPVGYQSYQPINYMQQPVNQQNQAPTNTGGLIWVQGEAGAKSYLVAPNSTVQLWDSEDPVIYLKSADASGMPSMKIVDYTVRGSDSLVNGQNEKGNNYICKSELDAIQSKIDALENEIKKLKPKKKKVEEEEDDD